MATGVSIPRLATASVVLVLAACGGGGGGSIAPASYTVGGTLTGLAANKTLTLSDNGADSLTLSASGAFTFAKSLAQGSSYSVTMTTPPAGQSCVVTGGTGSGISANVTAIQVTCSDAPQYAYVVNNGDKTVGQYSVTASGALTALSPSTIATGNDPRSLTVDPSHHYVYVTNLNDNTVSQYVIQADGTLAPNTPATVATGQGPWVLEFDPLGKFAYVANSLDNTISQYSVDASGVLEALAATPVATGAGPWNITLTPGGKYAYVSNSGGALNDTVDGTTLSQYAIAPDTGALSPLNPATVTTAGFPAGAAVDTTSSYAYVTSLDGNNVMQYSIGSSGALTPLSPASVNAGSEPDYILIHPTNKYAYVANYSGPYFSVPTPGSISQYNIGATGQLTPMTVASVAAGAGSGWLAIDTFGQFLYCVNSVGGTVSEYSIGADGSLTLLGNVAVGNSPFEMKVTYVGQ